jgi:hypothetical protein
MDFLRSSGHDGSRERKSWGSLGKIHVYIIFQIFAAVIAHIVVFCDVIVRSLWNVGIHVPDYTESRSRKPEYEELCFLVACLDAVRGLRL